MPIHQTKLMMSKAQPTGMLLPQMPMPLTTQVRRARRRSSAGKRERDAGSRAYQPSGVLRVRTIALILSVTDAEGVARRDDARAGTGVGGFGGVACSVISPSSGFGFRTAARYVVRGRVFSSASSA